MRLFKTRSTHHGLRLQGEKHVSKAILYIDYQIALELNRLGELAISHFQADFVDGRSRYQNLVVEVSDHLSGPWLHAIRVNSSPEYVVRVHEKSHLPSPRHALRSASGSSSKSAGISKSG